MTVTEHEFILSCIDAAKKRREAYMKGIKASISSSICIEYAYHSYGWYIYASALEDLLSDLDELNMQPGSEKELLDRFDLVKNPIL